MDTALTNKKVKLESLDVILLIFLTIYGILILFPFYNVIVVSFTTQKEYLLKSIVLFPAQPSIDSYATLFKDGRIWIGYRTTLLIMGLGLPINMLLTTSLSYGLSRPNLPGKKVLLYFVLFTMLFHGGIIPLYLVMMSLNLTNTIWSVVLAYGVNSFYFIIMRNYIMTLPVSLIESARLDGAGEWRILGQIILPLSMPIIATITLFYSVDRWNEWFFSMIFIRKTNLMPLQLVLRNIIMDSQLLSLLNASGGATVNEVQFSTGMKMGAVIVTMLPIMCVFPFLQKYFIKGVLIGAIKA